jgi:orotidine-5'-phosphate decarboxylase
MDFLKKLQPLWDQGKFVCVGLDSDLEKLPPHLRNGSIVQSVINFNREIIDATVDLVCCYKPNSAFYEALGPDDGFVALLNTIQYIRSQKPNVPIILDGKRGDIGNTNEAYAVAAFDELQVDALTINPYLGKNANAPFLNRKDKGIIVLVKTSNEGSDEFQNLHIGKKYLFEVVAEHVAHEWNKNGNCAIVVGATYPEELKNVRKIVGDMPILIPGIGSQGGDIKATVQAGKNKINQGMIINSSRGIIYASSGKDFAEVARRETKRVTDEIRKYL